MPSILATKTFFTKRCSGNCRFDTAKLPKWCAKWLKKVMSILSNLVLINSSNYEVASSPHSGQ